MRKKIGIITITCGEFSRSFNYGNKLQNYAIQKYLHDKGFEPETIVHKANYDLINIPSTKVKKDTNLLQFIDDVLRVLRRKIQKNKLQELTNSRINKFIDFNNKYINLTKKYYDFSYDLSVLNNYFDAFLIGSDQVWNPYYEGIDGFYFGDFVKGKKVITYAPSIAVSNVPNEIKEVYHNRLHSLSNISIRESETQKLLKDEFDIDATLVCDPVFLLGNKEWQNLFENNSFNEPNYIFTYLLGKKGVKLKRQISKIAKKTNCKVIDTFTRDNPDSNFMGPVEFLQYLKNSKYVITDSFHAVAFSIIFNKPVILVDRNNAYKFNGYQMNSRIVSLLNLVNVNSEDLDVNKVYDSLHKLDSIHYDYNKLNEFIDSSKKYLDSLLNDIK